jgi:hypothetical protein
MAETQEPRQKPLMDRVWSLDIESWDLIEIWGLVISASGLGH